MFERLESREMLSTVQWTGGGDGTRWIDPTNWTEVGTNPLVHRVPGSADDVVMNGAATVHASGSVTIKSLNATAGLAVDTGTFSMLSSSHVNTLQIQPGAVLNDLGGMTASGAIINHGTLQTTSATLNGPVTNNGLWENVADTTLAGTLTTSANSTFRITEGMVTIANGFTNYGTIQPMWSSQRGSSLTVVNGTLVNAVGATITYQGNGSDADADIDAQVTNLGTINAWGFLAINPSWTQYNPAYNPDWRFTNSGAIHLGNAGILNVSGKFDPSVGTIDGTGGLVLETATVNLSTDWTPTVVVGLIDGTTLAGPGKLTISAGNGVSVGYSTVNVAVDNHGILAVGGLTKVSDFTPDASTINGTLTTAPGSTLLVGYDTQLQANSVFKVFDIILAASTPPLVPIDADLTITGGFTNHGQIEISGVRSGSILTVTNGVLVNAADGTILNTIDSQSTFTPTNSLNANLDNQGTLNVVGSDLMINQAAGTSTYTVTNEANSTIDVGVGRKLTLSGAALSNQGAVKLEGNAVADFTATSITIDGQGSLQGRSTSTVHIRGALRGNTTNVAQFTAPGVVLFDGSGTAAAPQLLELMQPDQGNVSAGYNSNLAYSTLRLGTNTYVKLVDQADNSPGTGAEAGYAHSLVVPAGSTFDKNGLHFYAGDTAAPTAAVSLNTHAPVTNDTLTATATKADADGDPVTLTFVWKVNGAVKRTFTSDTALTDAFDLSVAGNGDHGDTIRAEVTPTDGTLTGSVATDTATIGYTAPSVAAVTLSGTQSGNVPIDYTLTDAESQRCSILVQYSTDGGTTWSTATPGEGGDGTTGLTSSAAGTSRTFVWASRSDISGTNSNVKIRITPHDGTLAGAPTTSGAFTVSNVVGVTIRWTGAKDGSSWNEPLNWDTHVVPTASDNVVIDVPGTPTIKISSGNQSAHNLSCSEPINISGGSLTVENSAQLYGSLALGNATIFDGTWSVASGIQLTGSAATLDVVTLSSPLNIAGGQTATLKNGTRLNGGLALGTNSTLIVGTGESLSVPTWSSLSNVNLVAKDGGVLTFPAVATLTSVNLTASGGGQILFPAATSYTGDNYADTTIQATDGGRIDLSHLATLAGGGYHYSNHNYTTHIKASAGGQVDLAGAIGVNPSGGNWNDIVLDGASSVLGVGGVTTLDHTSLSVNGGTISFPLVTSLASVNLAASGGGQILFPAATSYTGDNYADTTIQATDASSKIDLSHLATLAGGGYHYSNHNYTTHIKASAGGRVDLAGAIGLNPSGGNWNDIQVSGQGSVLGVTGITKLDYTNLAVTTSPGLTFPSATEVLYASLSAPSGITLTFPVATTLVGVNLTASGGGQILFPAATSCTGDNYADTTIQATDGGRIDLSHLATLAGGGYHYSNHNYTTHIKASAGGQVNLAGAIGVNPSGGNWNDIQVSDQGCLGVGGVTSLDHTSLSVNGWITLPFPVLTSLASVNLTASGGAQILFPAATSYTGDNYADTTIQATDGGRIDLSHLATLAGGGYHYSNHNYTTHIKASAGGRVDLAGAIGRNSAGGNPNDITLDGAGSSYGLDNVTSISSSSLVATNGATWTFPAGWNPTWGAGNSLSTTETGGCFINRGTLTLPGVTLVINTVNASDFINQGTLNPISGGVFDFNGVVGFNGGFCANASGIITGDASGKVTVAGDLVGDTKNASQFAPAGETRFDGLGTEASPQHWEVMGQDLGAVATGLVHNFAYGKVTVAGGTRVQLVEQSKNTTSPSNEAIYVDTIVVSANTILDLNWLHLYARTAQVDGTVLHGEIQIITDLMATVSLNTKSPRTNDTLTATVRTSGGNGNPVTLTYVWLVNGNVKQTHSGVTSATDTFDLSVAGYGNRGDTITVEVTPTDGTNTGAKASDTAIVADTAPGATVHLNTKSPQTNDTLTASVTTSDADADPVTLTYVWKVNGIAKQTHPGVSSLTDTFNLSGAGHGNRGDTITVEVTPTDGTSSGVMVSDTVIVADTAPVATVHLTPKSPLTNDTLTATATKTDVDGDPVSLTYVWFVNGIAKQTHSGVTSPTDTFDLSAAGHGDAGDTVTVEVTPSDATSIGAMVSDTAIVVDGGNHAPTDIVVVDTYNLASDWSDTENPFQGGVWQLNKAPGTPFTTPIDNWVESSEVQPAWADAPASQPAHVPVWMKITGTATDPTWTTFVQQGDIAVHGAESERTGTEYTSVGWLAKSAGSVVVSGGVWVQKYYNRPMVWEIRRNGVSLTQGVLTLDDPYTRENPFDFSAGSGGASALTFSVTTNDTIELLVYRQSQSTPSTFVGVNFAVDLLTDNQHLFVSENQPVGTVVGKLAAVDPDVGDTHTFALVSGEGSDDNASFTIDSNGRLVTAATFDYEAKKSCSIRVQTTDQGGLSYEEVFTIDVTNVNEAPVATVNLKPESPQTDDMLTATVTTSDPEGDPVSLTYVWKVNGKLVEMHPGVTSPTDTFDLSVAGHGDPDDTITVEVTPSDGKLIGTTVSDTAKVDGSPGDPVQMVWGSEVPNCVLPGQTFAFDVQYTTSNVDNTLTGLGLRIHYDSSKMTFNELAGVLSTSYVQQQGPQADTANYDDDPNTDKFILVAWADIQGSWPGQSLPAGLLTISFVAAPTLTDGTSTVRFSASSTAVGYAFRSEEVTIRVTTVNLDVDASGGVPDEAHDAELITRYLLGFTGAALTEGALSPGATRTDPDEIVTFLDRARSTMLDVDGNDIADALTDGTLIRRYLAGWPADQNLVKDALGSGATRTDPAAIKTFLDGFMPIQSSPTDGLTTLGLYDPTASVFQLSYSLSGRSDVVFAYGESAAGWLPIAGDWNGDGIDSVGLYDPSGSAFYLADANHCAYANLIFGYGVPKAGWLPIAGDWDGDGVDSVGLYDPSGSVFYLTDSNHGGYASGLFGYGVPAAGWLPIAGDWDGDGVDSVGLYDPSGSVFYLTNANHCGYASVAFGYGVPAAGWLPIAGDWDGNRHTSVALYDPAGLAFYVVNANQSGYAETTCCFASDGQGWLPIVGNWAGSGATLNAAEGKITSTGARAVLCPIALQPIVDKAIARWAEAGSPPRALAAMHNATWDISGLHGSTLGLTVGTSIRLDIDAAGHGWFVDPTPEMDEEFVASGGERQRQAVDPRGVDEIDLLTVVEHELGHVAGLDDLALSASSLMSGQLRSGIRRTVGKFEIDSLFNEGTWKS